MGGEGAFDMFMIGHVVIRRVDQVHQGFTYNILTVQLKQLVILVFFIEQLHQLKIRV